jgi:hypothetical protein
MPSAIAMFARRRRNFCDLTLSAEDVQKERIPAHAKLGCLLAAPTAYHST